MREITDEAFPLVDLMLIRRLMSTTTATRQVPAVVFGTMTIGGPKCDRAEGGRMLDVCTVRNSLFVHFSVIGCLPAEGTLPKQSHWLPPGWFFRGATVDRNCSSLSIFPRGCPGPESWRENPTGLATNPPT